MLSFLRKAYWLLLDLFFPPQCIACGVFLEGDARADLVCAPCRTKMHMHASLFCPICGARIRGMKKRCHRDAAYLLGAAGDYRDNVTHSLVHALKYKCVIKAADILGTCAAQYLERIALNWHVAFDGFLIVPIPLHKGRERARGFNQSLLIAEKTGALCNLPVCRALSRIRQTAPQTTLKESGKRKENVAGCFAVHSPLSVKGKNILLVDDVFTTGATAGEAVRALKSAGARKIIVLVSAKA